MTIQRSLIAAAIATALTLTATPNARAEPQAGAIAGEALSVGTVVGRVKESSVGASLDGAIISIDGRQLATARRNGEFRITGLAPGRYQMTVDYLGYHSVDTEVVVPADSGVQVEVSLHSTVGPADATTLDSVEVRATRDAQALALNQQRSSTNYVNVVSADLLGQFPDNNIAESTQRIPGVSIERDQGEGRYVTVRGAPKEFTTVTIDGVQLANPDNLSRGVELDTIPADVIAALEVTKALTPDMDGDAIAGNINIRTQSALDRDGLTLRASAAQGAFELGDGDNERYNATIGNRFGADENIGVIISASRSKQERYTDNVEATFADFDGVIMPEVVEIKDYEGTRTRTGLTGRFDFRIDPDNLVYFIASDSNFEDREFRDTLAIELERHEAGSNDVTGVAGRATFDKELRERTYDKSIRTYNLGGEHWLGDAWKLDWQVAQSKADKTTSPRMQYVFRSQERPRMAYDYSNPDFPVWTILGVDDAPATGVNLPEDWYEFRRLNDRYEYSEEKENSFRVDLTHAQDFLGKSGDIKFGVRSRQRDKLFNEERHRNGESDDFDALGISYSDMLLPDSWSNNFGHFLTGRRFARDIFGNYAGQLTGSSNHNRLVADSITADYTASEDVHSAYFRIDATWDKLTLVAGARYERTRLEGSAAEFNEETEEAIPQHASRSYGDFLPGLHLRYEIDQDTILRTSYSTGLNRPDFMHTAPYRIRGENAWDNVSVGNPEVEAAYAHNFDVSYERYLRPLGLLSAAAFYKRIDDPLFIANSFETWEVVNPDDGSIDIVNQRITRPENGDKGSIYGLELAWQQTFDMLPGALSGLGVYANYTWAKSNAELPFGLGETELPGTSRHNYNLALTYEKSGFNARLAYNHRSEFIQEFNITNPELNVFWDGRSSLDFTTSYRFNTGVSIFGEVNNISDTRQVRYQGQRNRVLEMEGFGRSWLVGVRYDY
ncbi:TonB-dependent receptor [Luteimonas terricola]|uniref:TonB-dependent receptor n=1 Tax=Luteimonas terricola TaxID=645597 RepID=A0ABQ2ED68_9GAMM|nr:TonB-dependent receptor [Luteimonas terricola]GGK07623.1 TonB-dependent receptor [Luteimonas terricola]